MPKYVALRFFKWTALTKQMDGKNRVVTLDNSNSEGFLHVYNSIREACDDGYRVSQLIPIEIDDETSSIKDTRRA